MLDKICFADFSSIKKLLSSFSASCLLKSVTLVSFCWFSWLAQKSVFKIILKQKIKVRCHILWIVLEVFKFFVLGEASQHVLNNNFFLLLSLTLQSTKKIVIRVLINLSLIQCGRVVNKDKICILYLKNCWNNMGMQFLCSEVHWPKHRLPKLI